MTKKGTIMHPGRIFMVGVLLGFTGCALDSEQLETSVLSPDDIREISHSAEFNEACRVLDSDGYIVQLEHGVSYRRGDLQEVIFEVEGSSEDLHEYKNIVYQQNSRDVFVFLELDAPGGTSFKASPTENQIYSCGSWSVWIDFTDASCKANTKCPPTYKATYKKQFRSRTCCDSSTCWPEFENREIFKYCGC